MPSLRLTPRAIILTSLAVVYAVLVFPFAYFRHDDWIILGNTANLATDWSQLWSTTLLFPEERPWFFRPLFRLATFLTYQAFGYQYWLWLLTTLAMMLGAIALAAAAATRLTGDERRGDRFALLFAAAVPLHFGTLAWAGEGLMNCPQLLLLAAAFFLFVRGSDVLAAAAFALSLLVKESSLFYTAFLFGAVLAEPALKAHRIRRLVPYAVIAAAYLVFRTVFVHLNTDYLPNWRDGYFLLPPVFFAVATLLPLVAWVIGAQLTAPETVRPWLRGLSSKWAYLPFVAVCLLPQLGHPFFSPGWLTMPGFFILLAATFTTEPLPEPRRWAAFAAVALAFGIAPTLLHLQRLGWWQWEKSQRKLVEIVRELPPTTKTIVLVECESSENPRANIGRVIGGRDSTYQVWWVHHRTPIGVGLARCAEEYPIDPHTVTLRYHFPDLELVTPPPTALAR